MKSKRQWIGQHEVSNTINKKKHQTHSTILSIVHAVQKLEREEMAKS